jgi:plasmid stabilization system protein ParE
MAERQEFEIIITKRAEKSYFEVLDYVFEYYTEDRANEIALELLNHPYSLKTFPHRGKLEALLSSRKEDYRYILYKRSNHTTVKIIYYVDETSQKVFITDFFPSEMNHSKVKTRS